MKILPVLLAVLVAGGCAARPASAVDVKINGNMVFNAEYTLNMGNGDKLYTFMDRKDAAKLGVEYHEKHQAYVQRLILGARFAVSENLSAYYDGIFGLMTWGGPASQSGRYGTQMQGGALGTRSANIVTRLAFLDWTIPHTRIKVRMGQQFFVMPYNAAGTPAMVNESASGIAVAAPVHEKLTLNFNWIRGMSEARRGSVKYVYDDDTLDVFSLLASMQFAQGRLTPWVGVSVAGKGGLAYGHAPGVDGLWPTYSGMLPLQRAVGAALGPNPAPASFTATQWVNSRLKNSVPVWAGVTGNLTVFEPLQLGFDSLYGTNGQSGMYKRAGWYASVAMSGKTAWGLPKLLGWYSTGDDGNIFNGSERPIGLYGGFGHSGADVFFAKPVDGLDKTFENGSPGGTWGISAQWWNFSVLPDLFHSLCVTYIHGGNSPAMARYAMPNRMQGYLTNKDSLVEVDFFSTYSIYKNLAAQVKIACLFPRFDGALWARAAQAQGTRVRGDKLTYSNILRTSFILRYTF